MINMWYDIQKHFKISQHLSHYSPIWGNAEFTVGRADGGFRVWAENGLWIIGDLYKKGNLMSFKELTEKIQHTKKTFF